MKILHVNSVDSVGGASRAAQRIHKGLLNLNLQSEILVQTKLTNDPSIIGPQNNFEKGMSLLCQFLDQSIIKNIYGRPKGYFSPALAPSSYLISKINALAPDIVHLHWICSGLINIKHLPRIKPPVVWTFHDMWPFTGGCHTSRTCTHYEKSCGNCPLLVTPNPKDVSYKVLKKKKQFWQKLAFTIVTPSQWLADCVSRSALLKNRPVKIIPNGLSLDIYKPHDKTSARKAWNLPLEKKLILFGAISAFTDNNKGFTLFCEAIDKLKSDFLGDTGIILFGAEKPAKIYDFGLPVYYLGQLHDDIALALLYSAADVMVVPSYQESFGQAASEAQACGCPVVAFEGTGLSDIVIHRESGYLAAPYKADDLSLGIQFVITDSERQKKLSSRARKKSADSFDIEIVAEQYKTLYESLLG